MSVLILTYHAVEDGPRPLCVAPRVFRSHLDAIAKSGATVLTIAELAERLAADALPERGVAITFDDGLRSVVEEAAPMLHARGMRATVFAVAGHLGGENAWPSQPARAPRRPLATAGELVALVDEGWEIGSHGFDHAPLDGAAGSRLDREVSASRRHLEEVIEAPVTSFALPYGAPPSAAGRDLLASEYAVACTTELDSVGARADPLALPRVEIHYVRRPDLLARALDGTLSTYLNARRLGARARRILRRDYAKAQ
jgi:peptidoglycan/xylan/chitin deacetylase (PgdA/CDA1 family)